MGTGNSCKAPGGMVIVGGVAYHEPCKLQILCKNQLQLHATLATKYISIEDLPSFWHLSDSEVLMHDTPPSSKNVTF